MSVGFARILEDFSHLGSFRTGDILGELPYPFMAVQYLPLGSS